MNNRKSKSIKKNLTKNKTYKDNKPSIKKDSRTLKRKIGDLGETMTTRFLMKQGYTILDRNYLKKFGELDIVAKKKEVYHFIEVKTVTTKPPVHNVHVIHETQDAYRPEDNLHAWKLRRLGHTIQAYMLEKRLYDVQWQFDMALVYVVKTESIAYINLVENIIL